MNDRWLADTEEGPLAMIGDRPRDPAACGRAAVFLDRDGVLNELVADPLSGRGESPLTLEQVRLSPGSAAAAARLARAGYALVCVSNQPAAAKGSVSIERLLAVHERVLWLLAEEGVRLDASFLCPHHPEGVIAALSIPCDCRKPGSGMLRAAAATLAIDLKRSWMVGDTDTDVIAGEGAGCGTVLIRNAHSIHKRLQVLCPDHAADSLALADGWLRAHKQAAST